MTYIKTRFARTMLGILKATQYNTKATWRYVTAVGRFYWPQRTGETGEQFSGTFCSLWQERGILFSCISCSLWQKSTVLGIHDGVAYVLLYNGILKDRSMNGGNVLTRKTLEVTGMQEKFSTGGLRFVAAAGLTARGWLRFVAAAATYGESPSRRPTHEHSTFPHFPPSPRPHSHTPSFPLRAEGRTVIIRA